VLVLVSFVLVLAAAVTLVVGLLQSGLTLIYLSIGCSVLAGVVLAVAVLRGRPEPRAAAPVGRAYSPPAAAPPPVPASVGAPSSAQTTSWSAPPSPPPPPPPPSPAPAGPTDDAATKAAGTALLGRLRRRTDDAPAATPEPEPMPAPEPEDEPATAQHAAVSGEADDGFPIADYDRMRATDLLRRLGSLDRNQLEAVRAREEAGKNRFTIMSRIDVLLAGMTEEAWEAADDDWEDDDGVTPPAADTTVIEVGAADGFDQDDEFAVDDDDWGDEPEDIITPIPLGGGEMEDDEVDELVSPAEEFPIAGYESLTVGQILPRLSDLDADQLAQVRAREQQGRARGTILDRVDRLASKSGAMAMPAPAATRRPRKAAAPAPAPASAPRKARAAKAPAASPMQEAVKKAAARSRTAAAKAPAPTRARKAPAAAAAATKAPARKSAAKKAPIAMPPADPIIPGCNVEHPLRVEAPGRPGKSTRSPREGAGFSHGQDARADQRREAREVGGEGVSVRRRERVGPGGDAGRLVDQVRDLDGEAAQAGRDAGTLDQHRRKRWVERGDGDGPRE
jgi:hypothetical protein